MQGKERVLITLSSIRRLPTRFCVPTVGFSSRPPITHECPSGQRNGTTFPFPGAASDFCFGCRGFFFVGLGVVDLSAAAYTSAADIAGILAPSRSHGPELSSR